MAGDVALGVFGFRGFKHDSRFALPFSTASQRRRFKMSSLQAFVQCHVHIVQSFRRQVFFFKFVVINLFQDAGPQGFQANFAKYSVMVFQKAILA